MRGLVLILAAACSHAPAARPLPVARVPATPLRTVVRPMPPLTPDVVLETIRTRYIGGLERCYGTQLRRAPAARGKVTVTLTIDNSGRPSARQARGVAPRVERCIETAMGRWAFPPARSAQSFQLSLLLRPT